LSSPLTPEQIDKLQKRLEQRFAYKSNRRRFIRYSLISINLVVLLVVIFIIIQRPQNSGQVSGSTIQSGNTNIVNPLDIISSADIARTVAQITYLPEATAVTNQAQTVNAQLADDPSINSIANHPLVVATTFKSRFDIKTYITQPGDTVASVAAKFNITSQSIEWSNNLNGNTVGVGVKLLIPPINGIVYTVKPGDSVNGIAATYSSNVQQLIAYNDAEISGITPGEQIIIPNGQIAAAPTYNFFSANFSATYGSNGYDPGFCTWYVASQISVPSNWGNASSWAYYAALSGWNVSTIPSVGAIAQTADAAGGEGHVGIVDAVSPDGTQIQFRDMNGIAGFDRVGYSGWVSASTFQHYITH